MGSECEVSEYSSQTNNHLNNQESYLYFVYFFRPTFQFIYKELECMFQESINNSTSGLTNTINTITTTTTPMTTTTMLTTSNDNEQSSTFKKLNSQMVTFFNSQIDNSAPIITSNDTLAKTKLINKTSNDQQIKQQQQIPLNITKVVPTSSLQQQQQQPMLSSFTSNTKLLNNSNNNPKPIIPPKPPERSTSFKDVENLQQQCLNNQLILINNQAMLNNNNNNKPQTTAIIVPITTTSPPPVPPPPVPCTTSLVINNNNNNTTTNTQSVNHDLNHILLLKSINKYGTIPKFKENLNNIILNEKSHHHHLNNNEASTKSTINVSGSDIKKKHSFDQHETTNSSELERIFSNLKKTQQTSMTTVAIGTNNNNNITTKAVDENCGSENEQFERKLSINYKKSFPKTQLNTINYNNSNSSLNGGNYKTTNHVVNNGNYVDVDATESINRNCFERASLRSNTGK